MQAIHSLLSCVDVSVVSNCVLLQIRAGGAGFIMKLEEELTLSMSIVNELSWIGMHEKGKADPPASDWYRGDSIVAL